MMTIGAVTEIGVSLMPAQPASPSAVAVERATTESVATVPETLRSTRNMTRTSMPNISGIKVIASCCPASRYPRPDGSSSRS